MAFAAQDHRPSAPSLARRPQHVGEHGHFFAVYDGHGPVGELVSRFAAERVPKRYAEAMAAGGAAGGDPAAALTSAHLAANAEVAKASRVDDLHSGTTAISVALDGTTGTLTIANVGDSRAMLGTRASGETTFTARALSNDQTPCVSCRSSSVSYRSVRPLPAVSVAARSRGLRAAASRLLSPLAA